MCDLIKVEAKYDDMLDYMEYVNTDVDSLMAFSPDVYAAYAAHNDKNISLIKEWFEDAEDAFVSAYSVESYLQQKYDIWSDDAVDFYYNKEVFVDETLYECWGYWFKTK